MDEIYMSYFMLVVILFLAFFEFGRSYTLKNTINCNTASQKQILTEFFSLTNGSSWKNKKAWLSEEDVCSWYGVYCDKETKKVYGIHLSNNNLSGEFSSQILSCIPTLRSIDFSINNLSGSLQAFSAISKLSYLNLTGNKFTGDIGNAFNELYFVRDINISYNGIVGEIPRNLYKTNPYLQNLNIDCNKLNSTVPDDITLLPFFRSFLAIYNPDLQCNSSAFNSANFIFICDYSKNYADIKKICAKYHSDIDEPSTEEPETPVDPGEDTETPSTDPSCPSKFELKDSGCKYEFYQTGSNSPFKKVKLENIKITE